METNVLGSGALTDIAGPLKDFSEKLGSSEGPMWLSAFKRFLRKENPWALKLIRQMTLAIGGVLKNDLLQSLKNGGNEVSAWASDIMSKPAFMTLPEPVEIELGWITVRDLGFNKEPTITELLSRIKEVGELCPAEVGPHLRLVDKNQHRGAWYWVAMEPISVSDGYPNVFCVERLDDGKRWLFAYCAHPELRWPLGSTLVFVLRK